MNAKPTPDFCVNNAGIALMEYDDDEQTAVVDLLTDLQHFCVQFEVDFEQALELARVHFDAEK
jgi:hypothetical protein